MPNKHAALKDLRKNKRHADNNLRTKTNVKSLYKKAAALVKEGKKVESAQAARAFQQAVDKAAKVHIISPNAAGRKKASLLKQVNALA